MMFTQPVLKKLLLALVGLFACGVASAAEDSSAVIADKPAQRRATINTAPGAKPATVMVSPAAGTSAPAFRLGGVTAYPGFGLVMKSDSNISRVGDADPAKLSSKIAVLSPSLVLQAQMDADTYLLAYAADIARYSNSSPDNYVDQQFIGLAELGLSMRATLKIQPEYMIGHDDRGSTFGTPTVEPNTWHSTGLNGSFSYGAEEARGHVVLDLGYTAYQYQNNRTVTADYDKKLTSVGGTIYFRVQPKTSLLANAKLTNISYKQIGPIPDGNEQRFLVGVKWEATAQTTGEVKIGQLQKKFDSIFPSYTGGSWEGDVRWSPVSFVNVDLVSSRQTNETTLLGSSTILLSNSGANVAFDLSDRVTLHAKGYRSKEDFVGANRVDHTNTWGLKVEYNFRSWLVFSTEYTNSAKTSNDALNDYSRNIFMLSVRTVL